MNETRKSFVFRSVAVSPFETNARVKIDARTGASNTKTLHAAGNSNRRGGFIFYDRIVSGEIRRVSIKSERGKKKKQGKSHPQVINRSLFRLLVLIGTLFSATGKKS